LLTASFCFCAHGVLGDVEPGDLIRWSGRVWLVRKVESELVTAIVESADGGTAILPSDTDRTGGCEVWCQPSRDWPSAPLPFRSLARLVGVRRATTDLVRLHDWVKLDDFQIGGALYLNPTLDLSYGDRLTAVYSGPRNKQTTLPVEIPRNFNPLPRKHSVVPQPAAGVATRAAPKTPHTLFALLKDEA